MFETMTQFLWFFFLSLGAISLGIIFEEKLIAFENAAWRWLKRTIRQVVRHDPAYHA